MKLRSPSPPPSHPPKNEYKYKWTKNIKFKKNERILFFSALIIPIGGKLSLWTNFHGMAKHFKQISGESKQLYSTSTNFSVENSRDIIILRGGRTIDDANNKTSTILSLLSSPLNKLNFCHT